MHVYVILRKASWSYKADATADVAYRREERYRSAPQSTEHEQLAAGRIGLNLRQL